MKFKRGDIVAFRDDTKDVSTVTKVYNDGTVFVKFDNNKIIYAYSEENLVLISPIEYKDFQDKIGDRLK